MEWLLDAECPAGVLVGSGHAAPDDLTRCLLPEVVECDDVDRLCHIRGPEVILMGPTQELG